MPSGLTISEAAHEVQLTTHTLRYYERIGLLDPVPRIQGDRRRYSEADLSRIESFNRLRATGMPIRKMQAFAQLAREGDQTIPARRHALEEHRECVLAHVAELQQHLAALERKIVHYRKEEQKLEAEHDRK